MRIAFLVDQFPTLSETFILNQIVGLIDRGHDVDIYADLVGNTTKTHPDVERYGLLARTTFVSMPGQRSVRVPKGIGMILANLYKAPLVLLRSLNFLKYNASTYGDQAELLKLLYATVPIVGKPTYDLIHCHYGRNGIRGLMLKEIGAIQGKLIVTYYGFDISQYVQQFGNRVYQQLFVGGDLFCTLSNEMKQHLIELGCDPQKAIIHHIGIDCNKFSFTPRYLQPNGAIQLASLSRLVEKKGLEYSIRAVARLSQECPKIQYKIVGDGPLKNDLQTLIHDLGVSDNVELLGWKQQHEIVDILNRAHILLAPSVTSKRGDREGTPVAIMEAMAMGLPVVATQHSGIPELVENEVTGLLVPERDVDALAAALHKLVQQPDRWVEMGYSGRARIEEHYNIDKLNDRLVGIYENLISNSSTSNA